MHTRLTQKRTDLTVLGTPEREFEELRERWRVIHHQRAEVLAAECARLTELSDGLIRASLRRGAIVDGVAEKLRSVLTGSGIKGEKLESLCEVIATAEDPILRFHSVLDELDVLARFDREETPTGDLPATRGLDEAKLSKNDLERIAKKLRPESWLDLCLVPLGDRPVFEYRIREGEYMRFEDASAGQQATALLWALLNQEGPPLIVDQPEDDLDNQIILKIVEQIWRAKRRRQLLFSSHNANIVVNGDAELVVCCDYRVSGDQSGGRIKCEGAIDVEEIRNEIATVMEGGREAFKLRMEKYGF